MFKELFKNIIIDVARNNNNTKNRIDNPEPPKDEQCEDILQNNIKENGFIDNKEKALLAYSEKYTGIPLTFFTRNLRRWFLFFICCFILSILLGILYSFIFKKFVNPNPDIIYIESIYWYFCFAPSLVWLIFAIPSFFRSIFVVINLILAFFRYILVAFNLTPSLDKSNTDDADENDDNDKSIINSSFNPLIWAYEHLCKYKWFEKLLDVFSPIKTLNQLKDHKITRCLFLIYWKLFVIVSFVTIAINAEFSFQDNKAHQYKFTTGDSCNFGSWFVENHAYWFVNPLSERIGSSEDYYGYLHELRVQIQKGARNIKNDPWATVKNDYENKNTNKTFNEFCFGYIRWCLFTPVILHLIYLVFYIPSLAYEVFIRLKKRSIKTDDSGNPIDVYQRNVLKNLKDQYKSICDKLVWFSNPEEPSPNSITLSAFKNWFEINNNRQNDEVRGEDYIFLSDNKDVSDWTVNNWINNQNKLSVRPYVRTLVCLCDINQPISTDCDNLNFISSLSKKDRYHIRFALVLDKNLIESYSADRDSVKSQLEQWKNELNSLKEGFSEEDKFFEKIVCVYLLNLPVPKMNFKEFNNKVNDYLEYRDLEDAFKFISEKLELLTRKNVCLQISEKSNDAVDILSNLKESITDDQDALYFDNVQEIKNWVDNQNQFKDCSLKRKLICLCDISQPISKDCFRQISRLASKDKFDIVIPLLYNEALLKTYPSQRDTIDSQLEQWKSELLSLKNEKFSKTFVWVRQHIDSDSLHDIINSAAEKGDANMNIEEAFNQITELLELQCHKYVWLTVSELSEKSVVKQLKNWCSNDKKNNVFLDGKNEVESWVEKYNQLEVPNHTRTLVCLCDVSQPISNDIINQIDLLSSKDKYDLVISLIYNDDLFKQYPSQRSTIDGQLNQWKSELDSLKKSGFSKTFICCRQIAESDILPGEIIKTLENKDADLELDKAFNQISEMLDLQCHKLVWLPISELSEKSIVKRSNLKTWCDKDKQGNILLDDKKAIESWVEKHNQLVVPSQTRTLVCLCDVSQPISKERFNPVARLSSKDKYDIVISLVYDENLIKSYPAQRDKIDRQLEDWKSNLLSLENGGFSKTFVCSRQFAQSDSLPVVISNEIEKRDDANLELKEAFRRLKEIISESDKPKPTGTDLLVTKSTNSELSVIKPSVESITVVPTTPKPVQISLIDQLKSNLLPAPVPVVPPEPQPYCMTLVIFNGVKKEAFEEKFNKFAGKAKKAPKRFYQKVGDPKIIEDIDKDIQDDKVNNTAVYYRIALIAKVTSHFDTEPQEYLNAIVEKIASTKQKQTLQVNITVTDMASCREDGLPVDDYLDYYRGIVITMRNNAVWANVDYEYKKFDYPIAGSDRWTNFCNEIFPDSDIKIAKLPSPEQRQVSFSKALDAIKISCKYAFKNSQDEKAQTGQIQDLNKAISDIYISNGSFFALNFLDNVSNALQDGYEKGKEIVQAGYEKGKDYVDKSKDYVDRKIESLIKKYAPLGGAILGGCIGGLLGHPIIGIAVGYTAIPIKEYYDKRRKARIEEDPAFEEKPEDVQYRILQVEALIATGLLRTLVLDGQGYSEETISGTIQQVLHPLDKLHIYTEDDMEKFLDEAKNRWEKRCLSNK